MLDKIQRIDGVGNVNTFGSSYAMRVWLNPEKLAERGLTVSDVVSAIKEQNMSLRPHRKSNTALKLKAN